MHGYMLTHAHSDNSVYPLPSHYRYVNPRALTHRSDEGESSGVGGVLQEGQEKRGTKKPAKRARMDVPLTDVATPLPAH